ncbi:MAG: LemA family protein, partial [Synergistaceae bacterium]|nr:LemA family protein [Synergistaceae bacterium]
MQEKSDAAAKMDEVAGRLNILAESYPELRSSETFQQLQRSVMEAEGELQAARRIYNMNVSQFDQLLASWPAGIVGRKHGHVPAEFFEAEPTKRGDVKMAF